MQNWKKGMELYGLRVNTGKMKVMRCQMSKGQDEDSGKHPWIRHWMKDGLAMKENDFDGSIVVFLDLRSSLRKCANQCEADIVDPTYMPVIYVDPTSIPVLKFSFVNLKKKNFFFSFQSLPGEK